MFGVNSDYADVLPSGALFPTESSQLIFTVLSAVLSKVIVCQHMNACVLVFHYYNKMPEMING